MIIKNQTKQAVLATEASCADTAFSRLKGLLGRNSIGDQEALVITDCRSIHMFFMRFAIDVIFIDRQNTAIGLVHNIKPFQMSAYYFRAVAAIELPAGRIRSSGTEKGDVIGIKE